MPRDSLRVYVPAERRAEHARPPRRLRITQASSVEPKPVEWLWRNRLALGKLCVIAGAPGLGKSQLTIFLAAVVTTGRAWPDSTPSNQGDVLIISAEDSLADTIRPRLDAAGADADRAHVLSGVEHGSRVSGFVLTPEDVGLLDEELTARRDVRLVVIDPITAFLGDTDSHKVADVRGVLQPLADLAEKHGVAVVAITHLNKGNGTDAMGRVAGSGAFIAAPRTAFLVVADEAEPERRLFLELKNNIGRADGLAFRVEAATLPKGIETSRIVFEKGTVSMTASEAMGGGGDGLNAVEEACEFLRMELAEGPKAVRAVEGAAEEAGISTRTLQRARQKVGIVRQKAGMTGGWTMRLPRIAAPSPALAADEEVL